jgi:hypothetical protein
MLLNGTEELRGQVGRARGLLAGSGGALPDEADAPERDGLGRLDRPQLVS